MAQKEERFEFDPEFDSMIQWYRLSHRKLPWRDRVESGRESIYATWVSEVMLQQTQVSTVVDYFHRFFDAFPTVHDLARASETRVFKLWEGLGYYRRARFLLQGAKLVSQMLNRGEAWPQSLEEWRKIPGIGPYTAGAITSIAQGIPSPIVDGNVSRVFSRYFAKHFGNSDAIWKVAENFIIRAEERGHKTSDANQSLMELGAIVCTPKKPQCSICPLRQKCKAFERGVVEKFPKPKVRAKTVIVREKNLCLWIKQTKKNWIFVVPSKRWRKGTWDFPDFNSSKWKTTANPLSKVTGMRWKKAQVIKTQNVVTHHKITRVTEVWTPAQPPSRQIEGAKANGLGRRLSELIGVKGRLDNPMRPKLTLGRGATRVIEKISF